MASLMSIVQATKNICKKKKSGCQSEDYTEVYIGTRRIDPLSFHRQERKVTLLCETNLTGFPSTLRGMDTRLSPKAHSPTPCLEWTGPRTTPTTLTNGLSQPPTILLPPYGLQAHITKLGDFLKAMTTLWRLHPILNLSMYVMVKLLSCPYVEIFEDHVIYVLCKAGKKICMTKIWAG